MTEIERQRRYKLNQLLKEILGSDNVYFQPPESLKLKYPAIIYKRSNIHIRHGSNEVYRTKRAYQVTVVDKDPDSPIVERMSKVPTASFGSHYTADNLNHDTFTIWY